MSTNTTDHAIEIRGLEKVFRTGFKRQRVDALRGISLDVPRGLVFGFLGPNGAGKTTTLKILNGLIHPTRGEAFVLGLPIGSREATSRVGFQPEHPYFYDYLTAPELLQFYGRLFGLTSRELKKRCNELIERVGLGHAQNRPIRKFSKGMKQRLGLAQAIINKPDLIILDEPLSGLDPIGRKEIRDILAELKEQGATIFFSSHILAEIEMICDAVAIIHKGKMVDTGSVSTLLEETRKSTDIIVRTEEKPPTVLDSITPHESGELWCYSTETTNVNQVLEALISSGIEIVSVMNERGTLEDLFMKEIRAADNSLENHS